MSLNNVLIKVYESDVLVDVRELHNVWVGQGRVYLANMLGYTSHGPDVPEETARLSYLGVGIGGKYQGELGAVGMAPLSVSYPADGDGQRPGTTTDGNQYDHENSQWVPITTLERPVRISGGSNPYGTAAGGDVWLVEPPNLFTTHMSLYDVTVHAVVDGSAGDVSYAPFGVMPVSEAALFVNQAGLTVNDVYPPLVAYAAFGTIPLGPSSRVEFIWSIRFN